MIASMQFTTPIMALLALMIAIGQEENLGSITKDYVTIAFILSIDNVFAQTLSENIKLNARKLNGSKVLKMGKDYNKYRSIYKRLKKLWYLKKEEIDELEEVF